MSNDFWQQLQQRLASVDGSILTYEEVERWPEGMLEELIHLGKIREGPISETVICTECTEGCPIIPEIFKHPETGELFGVYVCPYQEDIGRIAVDLKRRQRWEIIGEKLKKRKRPKARKQIKRVKAAATSFIPWRNPGEACFVIDGSRIKFWNGDDLKDIRLKNNSKTHLLLNLLSAGDLVKAEVKKAICTPKVSPFDAVRNINRTLNGKMKEINISNVPENVEFISRDEQTERYYSRLPIMTMQEFNKM